MIKNIRMNYLSANMLNVVDMGANNGSANYDAVCDGVFQEMHSSIEWRD